MFLFFRKLYGFRTLKPVNKGLDYRTEAKLHFLEDIQGLDGQLSITATSLGCGTRLESLTTASNFQKHVRADKFAKKLLTVG